MPRDDSSYILGKHRFIRGKKCLEQIIHCNVRHSCNCRQSVKQIVVVDIKQALSALKKEISID